MEVLSLNDSQIEALEQKLEAFDQAHIGEALIKSTCQIGEQIFPPA